MDIASWLRWTRCDLSKLVEQADPEDCEAVRHLAADRSNVVIPGVPLTEHSEVWRVLRKQATRGQIDPRFLRRMRTADLEYLAGCPLEPADAKHLQHSREEQIKVNENGYRAQRELQRRLHVAATAIAAGVGGVGGGLVALLVQS